MDTDGHKRAEVTLVGVVDSRSTSRDSMNNADDLVYNSEVAKNLCTLAGTHILMYISEVFEKLIMPIMYPICR